MLSSIFYFFYFRTSECTKDAEIWTEQHGVEFLINVLTVLFEVNQELSSLLSRCLCLLFHNSFHISGYNCHNISWLITLWMWCLHVPAHSDSPLSTDNKGCTVHNVLMSSSVDIFLTCFQIMSSAFANNLPAAQPSVINVYSVYKVYRDLDNN